MKHIAIIIALCFMAVITTVILSPFIVEVYKLYAAVTGSHL